MDERTFRRILDHLSGHPGSTASQLARYFQLTPADIRYHLRLLEDLGLVRAGRVERPYGRGRPAAGYELVQRSDPALAELSRACLAVLFGKDGLPAQEHQQSLARALEDAGLQQLPAGAERLSAAVGLLTRRGYRAAWEPRPRNPLVTFHTCPFSQLVGAEPRLCEVDRLLVEKLSGWQAKTQATIAQDPARIPACIFILLPVETLVPDQDLAKA